MLNFDPNNIKTHYTKSFPHGKISGYMKLSKISIIHIKGTMLYTKKKKKKGNIQPTEK